MLTYVLRAVHVLVYSLFFVAPIVCGGFVFRPCFVIQGFVSFLVFAIIRLGKR